MSDDSVTEDSELTPEEKEVAVRFSKDNGESVVIHSEIASVTRALRKRDDYDERRARRNDDGEIVSTTGTLPLGVLKIQQNARKHGSFSRVVSDG